jgi:predicted amidohydrolase YtcJ
VSRKRAFTNCTVYLGGGNRIARGFVVFDGERIERVGALSDFARPAGVEVTDLRGKLLLPGLIDSHIHLVAYAGSLIDIDLADTASLDAGLEAVRSWVAGVPKGAWVCGRGWDKQRWRLDGVPTRWALDQAAPDHPVLLTSRDGHLAWLNSAALDLLGLAEKAPAVEGGEIPVDGSGVPMGIFKEKAVSLVIAQVDALGSDRVLDAVKPACGKLRRLGITAVHTIEDRAFSGLLSRAVERGDVSVDLFRMREVLEPEEIADLKPSAEVRCIKTYADGTLGSQTASMLEPFAGQPGNLGIPFAPAEKLRRIVMRAVTGGFAVSVHAIGDRANKEMLDIYEEVRRSSGGGKALLRIEHAQVLRSKDIPRFADLRIVASMQPIHLVADRHVAERYWGARSANAYAWKRILGCGGTVAFGSDAPVESPDPLRGIHAAVTRSDPGDPGADPWYPSERIPVWQALDSYTGGGAGMRAGRPARFTVLDRDILGAPDASAPEPDVILKARVAATVVAGEPEFYD